MAAVASVCPNRFTLASGLAIPYCANRSLDQPDPSVVRAVVVIHGTGRNGPGYFRSVESAATTAGTLSETIIVAPHFLIEEDIDTHSPGADVPFWTNNGWKQGDASLSTENNPRPATTSSFNVLDEISARLNDPAFFPNLRLLVIAGHSAGGQFVNRYAAAHQSTVAVRYVVANPSSYLYMTDERRVAGTTDQFAVPNAGDCSGFNDYKYGLQALNPYMAAVGATTIRDNYATRRVVYLLGTADNDPKHPELDKNCESMLQGDHRLERGHIYFNYVQHVYGSSILDEHTLVEVSGVGHSAGQMFRSPEGVRELFPPLHVLADPELDDAVQSAVFLLLDDAKKPVEAPDPDVDVQLEPPLAGFHGNVLGVAADDDHVYATHGYRSLANPPAEVPPGTLAVVDRRTMTVESRIGVGFGPNSVAVNPLTKRAYVVNRGKDSLSVSVIDTVTRQVVEEIGIGHVPIDVAVNTRLNRIYVSNPFQQRIEVIDGATNTTLAPIPIGPAHGLAVEETTNTIYAALTRRHNNPLPPVTAIGTVVDDGVNQPRVLPPVDLTGVFEPVDVAVDPIGDRIYVATQGNPVDKPAVVVLDRATRQQIALVHTRGPVRALGLDTHRSLLFAAGDRGIDVVDTATLAIIQEINPGVVFSATASTGPDRQLFAGNFVTGQLHRRTHATDRALQQLSAAGG